MSLNYVFSCFKFVELLIKITPSVIKIECGTKILGNTCSQSISYFKATRVFNSQLTKKPSSYIHRGFSVTLYLFDFVWWRGAFRTQSNIYNGVFCETLFRKKAPSWTFGWVLSKPLWCMFSQHLRKYLMIFL